MKTSHITAACVLVTALLAASCQFAGRRQGSTVQETDNAVEKQDVVSEETDMSVTAPVEEEVTSAENSEENPALCTGPGRIIHSSKIVRENSLVEGEPDYYEKNLLHVRRIAGNFKGCSRVLDSPLYFDR